MAEVITKVSDLKKIFAKLGIEEEPVIVLQRFLNVFKQLHIFDEKKKESFNKEILALPPEARGMFKALPGGSLLQEYVNDLEQQTGKMRDRSNEAAAGFDYGASKNSVPTQAAVPAAQAPVIQAPVVAGGELKVVADDSFAKQMAVALAGAMTVTEKHNNQKMLGDIIKAQSDLFSNMAHTQTKELSSIISIALKESHELSTKSIIDAIKIFQKENLDALTSREAKKKESTRVPEYRKMPSYDDEWEYIEVDANHYNKGLNYSILDNASVDLESLEKPTAEAKPLDKQADDVKDLTPTQAFPSSIEPAKARLEKIKEDMAAAFEPKEEPPIETPADPIRDSETAEESPEKDETLSQNLADNSKESIENEEEVLDLDAFLVGNEESVDTILSKEEAKANKKAAKEKEKSTLSDVLKAISSAVNVLPSTKDEEAAENKEVPKDDDDEEWEWQEVEDEEATMPEEDRSESANFAETGDALTKTHEDLDSTESGSDDNWEWEYEEVPEDGAESDADGEWEWEEVEEGSDDAEAAPKDGEEDWEWEYEEVPEDGTAANGEFDENGEWGWEEAEEAADDISHVNDASIANKHENNVSGSV